MNRNDQRLLIKSVVIVVAKLLSSLITRLNCLHQFFLLRIKNREHLLLVFSHEVLAFLMTFAWGFADSANCTHTSEMLGFEFDNNS